MFNKQNIWMAVYLNSYILTNLRYDIQKGNVIKSNINYDGLEVRLGYQTYLKHGGFANILYSI